MTDKAARRSRFVAEDLGSHLPPHERRAASATDDRKLRSTMLAANSGRLMATLEAERGKLGLADGYRPEVGPTGDKPLLPLDLAPAASVATVARPVETPVDDVAVVDLVELEDGPVDLVGDGLVQREDEPVGDGAVLDPVEVEDLTAATAVVAPAAPVGVEDAGADAGPDAPLEPAATTAPAAAIPQLIRELAGLHADGILTDEEFGDKKRELLARL